MKLSFIVILIISMNAINVHSQNNPKFSGRMTVCKNTVIELNDPSKNKAAPYYSENYGNLEEKKKITIYYNANDSERTDYTAICGTYGEIAKYTFIEGIKDGAYSYYFHEHGGNCEETITMTGSYKNNQKDGTWIKEDILDCAGLLSLKELGRWLNGSYDQMTYIVYNDGRKIAGPVSYYKE